jgi:pre-mRNA-splicing factor CWC26
LRSGSDFAEEEARLRRERHDELKAVESSGMSGAGEGTVYRDKRGRKLDVLNEFMRQQAAREGKVCFVFYFLFCIMILSYLYFII